MRKSTGRRASQRRGRPLRISMVSEHASPLAALGGVDAGGQNVHVAALATALARKGADVVVHTRRDDADLPPRVPLVDGVLVDHVDAGPPRPISKDDLLPFMEDFAAELSRRWSTEPPDVVHSHFWMSGRAALTAARPLRVPVSHTFHALGVVKRRHQGTRDTSPRARLAEESTILARADQILATCSNEVFELKRLGADLRRVHVIPCGVDLARFTPAGPVEPRNPRRARLVVVSRLVERKGIADAVRALVGLPAAELVVAGGPAADELEADREARRLRALARRLGVADRLVLRGRLGQADLPAVIRSADVLVSVPWYEPFGMVAVEAMACGVPVVASAVGGQTDTVVDGVTGMHVPPRAPAELATALAALLGDPARRRALGAAGARRARARYGWDRVADATLSSYESVLADRRRTMAVMSR